MQDPMIEKYRQELMEFSRRNPRFANPPMQNTLGGRNRAEQNRQTGGEVRTPEPESMRENRPEAQTECESEPNGEKQAKTPEAADNAQEQAFVRGADVLPPYNTGVPVEYATREAFLRGNPQLGFLRVQVFAADQAYPIQNANVTVSKHFSESDSVFFSEQTDASGIMSRVSLPAPDRSLSVSPSALQPYATYDIEVTHPGFTRARFKNCVIFDGIETIQQVELVPGLADEGGD